MYLDDAERHYDKKESQDDDNDYSRFGMSEEDHIHTTHQDKCQDDTLQQHAAEAKSHITLEVSNVVFGKAVGGNGLEKWEDEESAADIVPHDELHSSVMLDAPQAVFFLNSIYILIFKLLLMDLRVTLKHRRHLDHDFDIFVGLGSFVVFVDFGDRFSEAHAFEFSLELIPFGLEVAKLLELFQLGDGWLCL